MLCQRGLQFVARADAELGEHLAQVPLDGARAEEQPRADLRVRQAVAGQPGDLLAPAAVSSSRVSAAPLAHLLARRRSAPGARARRTPPCRSRRTCRVPCAAGRGRRRRRFSRRSHSPYSRCARASSGRSRVRLSRSIASWYRSSAAAPSLSSARQRASMPSAHVGAAGPRRLREPLERVTGELGLACARGRLDELGQRPHGPRVEGVRGGLPGRRCRLLVAGEAVVQDRGRPVRPGRPPALALRPRRARSRSLSLRRPRLPALAVPGASARRRARWRLPVTAATLSVSAMTDAVPAKSPIHGSVRPKLEREVGSCHERAGVAGKLDVSHGDGVHGLEVPYEEAGGRRDPAPPQDVLDGDVGDRSRCSLQGRSRGGGSVGSQQGDPVEHQVEGTRITRRQREGPDGAADLQEDVPYRR